MKTEKLYASLIALGIYCGIASVSRANLTYPIEFTHPNQPDRTVFVDQSQIAVWEKKQGRPVVSSDLAKANKYAQVITPTPRKGPGVGGGGFSYSRTAMKHLREAIETVTGNLELMSDQEFHRLQQNQDIQLPLAKRRELVEIVRNTRVSFTESVSKIGPSGQIEPLMMDYRVDPSTGEKFIIVLPILLQTYNRPDVGYIGYDSPSAREIARMLLHEASHHLGMGVENDDESFSWSSIIMASLNFADVNFVSPEELLKSGKPAKFNLIAAANPKISGEIGLTEITGLQRSQEAVIVKEDHVYVFRLIGETNTTPFSFMNGKDNFAVIDKDKLNLCTVLNERKYLGKKWIPIVGNVVGRLEIEKNGEQLLYRYIDLCKSAE